MNEQSFDSLAQHGARGISRRASLLTIGTTGLAAALSTPIAADAKKKKRKKENKCKRQVGQCNAYFVPLCEEENAPETCTEQIGACCEFLGACQAEAFIDCFMTLVRPPRPETP